MFNPLKVYTSARDHVKAAKLSGDTKTIQSARDALGRAINEIYERDPKTDLRVLKALYKGAVSAGKQEEEEEVSSSNTVTTTATDHLAPRGIQNIDANCWANTTIQFILGNTELLDAILTSENCLIQPIKQFFLKHIDGKRPNSQDFRVAIADLKGVPDAANLIQFLLLRENQETVNVLASSKDSSICHFVGALVQRDAGAPATDFAAIEAPLKDGIIHFLKHTEGVLETLPCKLKQILEKNPVDKSAFNRAFAIALYGETPREANTQLDVADAMGILLDRLKMDDRVCTFDKSRLTNDHLQETPTSLFVQAAGFSDAQIQEEYALEVGENRADYRFVQCAIHIGEKSGAGAVSGHFVSLRKIGTTFYHINDESVFKWDVNRWIHLEGRREKNPENNTLLGDTPQAMMRQGSYFHYERIEDSAVSASAAAPHTAPHSALCARSVADLTATNHSSNVTHLANVTNTIAWYMRVIVLISAIFAFIFPVRKK